MLYAGALILSLVSIAASFVWGRAKYASLAVACAILFPVVAASPIYLSVHVVREFPRLPVRDRKQTNLGLALRDADDHPHSILVARFSDI